ncbi:non-ribosomal peptide synthetase [Flavobacterium sp. N502540]|uniref:non-ribosomal peptide synthetase n=1 Tax=Flavobacterium sp. N502540 TaxID=2986838 RepID=UPI0022253F73|nr:non-ribosomal peptide synthetase [Flavobacterium sp. N502540]
MGYDLFTKLKKLKVTVKVIDNNLDIKAPKGVLNEEILNEIKSKKEELIHLVTKYAKDQLTENYSIPVAPKSEHYPLSSSQRRLWVLSQIDNANFSYNIPGVQVIDEALDANAFIMAIRDLIDRHEVLRTVFKSAENEEVRQFIIAPEDFEFPFQQIDVDGDEEKLNEILTGVHNTLFDLEKGPLFKGALVRVSNTKFVFAYNMHHIISDGWSIGIMINELLKNYTIRKNGETVLSNPLQIHYKDYAVWQQKQLSDEVFNKERNYWLTHLAGDLPTLSHFGDYSRPAIMSYNGSVVKRSMDALLIQQLRAFCQKHEGTLFMGCLSILNVLLHKYTEQEDFIIGSPVSGRTHKDMADQIGFYVNTLALRTQFGAANSFEDVFQQNKRVTLHAIENQNYPFDELLDNLNVKRDLSRSPLFDVMISVQNDSQPNQQAEDLSYNELLDRRVSKYDLTFTFIEKPDSLTVELEYNRDIFSKETATTLLYHLENLLSQLLKNPAEEIKLISGLDSEEQYELLVSFNNTEKQYPETGSIVSFFAEQVERNPQNTALVYQDKSFTYSELDAVSNQLAHFLEKQYLLEKEDLIAILLPKSEWQIISILAILKAGCAYVPIASDYPESRIRFILEDTKCKLVVSEKEIADFLSAQSQYSESKTISPLSPSSLAYIMYTSGSTGVPKGALIEHGGVIRLVKESNYVPLTGKEALLSTGSFSFDAVTFEYWSMLLNGGKLVLCDENTLLSSTDLSKIIKEESISIMWFTAGLLNQIVEDNIELFEGLQTILAGGDKLSYAHISRLQKHYPHLEIINGYGPTENTTFSLTHKIEVLENNNIPIGKPITNSTVYILDKNYNLIPKGAVGEICLGGTGLSRGYLNQPELSLEKFVPNPFKPNQRLYKTGDLGRWLKDGTVEFLGRKDNQVKLRGYRIELGEIESVLAQHELINSSLAMVQEDNKKEKVLVAYITVNAPIAVSDLKQWLSQRLPYYMVPNYFEILDVFPLNVNGKVDRSKLPLPESMVIEGRAAYKEPSTELEKSLAKLWEDVLGISKVGLEDNFFDIGGHSLKATKLISKVHKEFQVKLKLKDLFVHATLQSQCKLIAEGQHSGYNRIPVLAKQDGYPLSLMQRRLWILSQHQAANIAYNMSGAYVFEGILEVGILEEAFIQLIKRHEILRTSFKEDANREILQYVTDPENISFAIKNIDLSREEKSILDQYLSEDLMAPFDLSSGQLLKASIYKLSENRWVFSNVIHHIISDGWSLEIIVNELLYLYNTLVTGEPLVLTPLNVQYKDYSSWQLEELSDSRLEFHKGYWINQFKGDLPVLDLSGGKQRPLTKTYNGGVYNKIISGELSGKLTEFLKAEESTLFMGLLSAVNVLFYHYTNQSDITIGSPIAGRDHIDLENQIGFYVNTLALRTQFSKEDHFKNVLSKVKEVVLGAHEHQLYPFDELVSSLNIPRDMSRNPLFDVQVIVQNNQNGASTELNNLSVSPYKGDLPHSSVFDLVFSFVDSENGLATNIIYNSDVFDSERIAQFGNHLEQLLTALLQNAELPILELKWLPKEEQQHLLDFNAETFDYDKSKNVLEMIREQVEKNPEAIAVSFEGNQLSYLELDKRSSQLAHFLLEEYQLEPNDFVGIMLDRSESIFIGILGILKAGAAYVPIDPDYPVSRKEYILKDTNVKALLTQSDYMFDLSYYEGGIFAMDVQLESLTNPITAPEITVSQDHLIYIIYTSGSTGNPKGVMVTHGNLLHSLAPRGNTYSPIKCFLLLSSVAFDSSVAGIFSTLTTGGTLCITGSSDIGDVNFIANLIVNQKVSHLLTVPSYYKLLLSALSDKDSSIEQVTVAGETCPISLIEDHFKSQIGQSGCDLFNEYGPTECSVWSSVHKYEEGKPVTATIGKPIANTRIYILNEKEDLVPLGVIGELHIGGNGVTNGYLNNPELTAQKFVKDRFSEAGLMYKTGDLGRWNSAGEIEFLGRKDNQVKVRGYRIELGEIQYAVEQYSLVEAAVILTKENKSGDNELYAYLLAKETVNTSELKHHLKDLLPSYAVPAHFITLEAFPLTPNGKIDTKALLEIGGSEAGRGEEYVAPGTEEEIALVNIWETVLDKEKIGVNDRFFDLGGDSIKVLKIVNGIYNEMQLDITISDIYTHDCISQLSDFIAGNRASLEVKKAAVEGAENQAKQSVEVLKNSVLEALSGNNADNVEDVYPMSDIQKGMIYESLKYEGASIYHDQMINHRQFPNFDISVFRKAMQLITEKHEILRTGFNLQDYDQEVQIVYKQAEIPVVYEDLSQLESFKEQEKVISAFLQSELLNSFDVAQAPLFRMAAFNVGNDTIVFISQCHHAIIDGWSDSLLLTEINNVYLKLLETPSFKPTKLKSSHKDYMLYQLQDKRKEETAAFWSKELNDYHRLDLFTEKEADDSKLFRFEKEELSKIETLKTAYGIRLKELALSAFVYTLKLYTYSNDITIGLVVNTRPALPDADGMLGCFLNTIPLRLEVDRSLSGEELLRLVKQKLIEVSNFSDMSLASIASVNNEIKGINNPFFDIIFNYVDFYSYDALEEQLNDEKESYLENQELSLKGKGVTNTYLDFTVNNTNNFPSFDFAQSRQLVNGIELSEIESVYKKVFQQLVDHPESSLKELDYLSNEEKELYLNKKENDSVIENKEQTVLDLFNEQVVSNPNYPALHHNGVNMSYAELDEKSNQLGHYLKKQGIGNEDFVAIVLDRSVEMLISIFGILKAGAAYVPLDEDYPQQRIDFILKDTAAKAIISKQSLLENFSEEFFPKTIVIDKDWHLISKESTEGVTNNLTSNSLIYSIYTSGTTGKPKGVYIEHKGVVNLAKALIKRYKIQKEEKILAFSNYVFDASVEQIFIALASGSTLVICDKEDLLDGEKFEMLLMEKKITHIDATPTYLENVTPNKYHLNRVVVGGEECSLNLARKWVAHTEFYNSYGPTETTVSSTIYAYDKENDKDLSRLPIGKPIENTTIYIVDNAFQIAKTGVVGEMYIGGIGVSRGYINQEALTKERFVTNPFADNEILYRTGDLCYWLPDGNIQFFGRVDDQVKIRGYRIELGEIENAFLQQKITTSVAVLAKENKVGEKEIVAYLVADEKFDAKNIRTQLKSVLPYFMIPSYYVPVEEIPLTKSRKVDRNKLLSIEIHGTDILKTIVSPENETENTILQIWQEILEKKEISVVDNFFEIGGYSLKAIKLKGMLRRKLGLDISIKDLYNAPTIRELALGKKASASAAINLQAGNLENTIYFIPPILGNSILYHPLAKVLGNQFNSIGLQYKGLEPDEELCQSIEEMADHFSKEIKKRQSNQPFLILGYSMGASIAFEVVKELEKHYDAIELVLVDRPTSLTGINADTENIDEQANWLLHEYEKAVDLSKDQKESVLSFIKNNLHLDNQYKLQGKISSTIHVLESAENDLRSDMMNWQNHTDRELLHHYLSGTHWEAFNEKNFDKYIEIFKSIIQKTNKETN